ncbi:uncharacterized protein G2W53_007326 [Senna tora]|uniref:Uncharacterized protein n=1 Tax=Senna tora TaxID=362788 RepID=A0A835CE41_9FABA|nr:uncharacterized protein G2W53_007326 [Senna tora]
MVQHAVDEQRQRIRDTFGFSCFIDYESILFVNEAVTFRMSSSRRTTRIRIRKEGEQVKYVTSEFKPISYPRTKSSSSSESRPTNIIRVSDASVSDSDPSSNTPQSNSSPSQNQPIVQCQGVEDNVVDIMDIDSPPVTTQEQLRVQDEGPHFLNAQIGQGEVNATIVDMQFINCQEQEHLADATFTSPVLAPITATPLMSNNSLDALLCTEDPESFNFMQSPPTPQFSELAQFLPSSSTAILSKRVQRRLSHISLLQRYDVHFVELSRDGLPLDNTKLGHLIVWVMIVTLVPMSREEVEELFWPGIKEPLVKFLKCQSIGFMPPLSHEKALNSSSRVYMDIQHCQNKMSYGASCIIKLHVSILLG